MRKSSKKHFHKSKSALLKSVRNDSNFGEIASRGNTRRKMLTVTCIVVLLLIAVAVTLVLRPKTYTDPFSYCNAVVSRDIIDSRYIGPSEIHDNPDNSVPVVWHCMDREVLGCNPGASGRACMQFDTSTTPNENIRGYCLNPHQYDVVPMSMNREFGIFLAM